MNTLIPVSTPLVSNIIIAEISAQQSESEKEHMVKVPYASVLWEDLCMLRFVLGQI